MKSEGCNNVKIDGNPIMMKECNQAFKDGDIKEGRRLIKEFLKSVEESGQDHCSCPEPCMYHGKCKECMLIHRAGMDHVPYCLRNLVNEKLEKLSAITEHSLKERI
jgi:hypothetical protein